MGLDIDRRLDAPLSGSVAVRMAMSADAAPAGRAVPPFVRRAGTRAAVRRRQHAPRRGIEDIMSCQLPVALQTSTRADEHYDGRPDD